MLDDDALKVLLRNGEWNRLEAESRNVMSQRTSKAAELYLLRALLEQGKIEDLDAALAVSLQSRPRATLRFMEREEKRIPQIVRRLAASSVFSDLTSEPPSETAFVRKRWPSFDVFENKDRIIAFLLDDVFAHAASELKPVPKDQVHVVTFGSCFAVNLYNGLLARDVRASTLSIEETVNTTFANRDILRFLYDGTVNKTAAAIFGSDDTQSVRDKLLGFVRSATHFVLTVGVAPAFFSRSGEYTLISSAKDIVKNQDDLVWGMTSVQENKANLIEAAKLLKEINSSADIVVTLSPVPLSTAFSRAGVMYEDLLSKATLRMAIQEFTAEGVAHYWPSFEAVKWVGAHASWPAFGAEGRASRQPSRWLVDVIIDAFCKRIIL
jgi:GSCFA family